ncbi:MAG TPA: cupin-like domain-containing protein [Bacteroidia bacterium]|nr:cupin-like domain-containing protein [Bacteroidia bacterium]HNT80797.1 cupin-like domain-containing protein [Bacteroidia bacterium]
MSSSPIERRSGLSAKMFLDEYIIPNKPVILTDQADDWEARKLFTPEFFKKNFPDKVGSIKNIDYKLGDYIDMMLSSTDDKPAPYPFKLDIDFKFTELQPYIQPGFEVLKKNRLKSSLISRRIMPMAATCEVFFGGRSGWFPYLHYDLYGLYAIVTQIYGRKEFIVYKPEDAQYMYPDPENPWMSTIEKYYDPDYTKYPKFKNATAISDTVHPGETIFVPKGWWHTARSLEPSISIAQDLLTHHNWDVFKRDIVFYKKKQSKVKAGIIGAYLSVIDKIMD